MGKEEMCVLLLIFMGEMHSSFQQIFSTNFTPSKMNDMPYDFRFHLCLALGGTQDVLLFTATTFS